MLLPTTYVMISRTTVAFKTTESADIRKNLLELAIFPHHKQKEGGGGGGGRGVGGLGLEGGGRQGKGETETEAEVEEEAEAEEKREKEIERAKRRKGITISCWEEEVKEKQENR